MRRKLVALLALLLAVASGSANAIVITLDNNALTVERPLTGTTTVDFTGNVTLTNGFGLIGFSASTLWTAQGDMIDSGFPVATFNLTGVLFSVTVSANDGLGLYAFRSDLTNPALVGFGECPTGGGGCNNASVTYSVDVIAPRVTVPEPISAALLALGLVGLGFSRSRRKV